MDILNDFTIRVATVNGSGSQSSNSILIKALFYMGIPVAGKNIFPSNIAGLPTWYNIRVSKEGYVGHKKEAHVLVLLNPETFLSISGFVERSNLDFCRDLSIVEII